MAKKKTPKVNTFEYTIMETLSAAGPWLSPLVPAMLTYVDATTFLTLGEFVNDGMRMAVGLIMALVIEIMGLVTGHTLAKYNAHNKRRDKRKGDKEKISLWPIVVAFGIYLTSVIMLNVVLPWSHITPEEGWTRLSIVSFTIPAIIVISTRSIHAEILMEQEAPIEKTVVQAVEKPAPSPKPASNHNGKSTPELLREFLKSNNISIHEIGQGAQYAPADIAKEIGVDAGNLRVAISREKSNMEA